ncbi:MAG TPA: PQQ-binding-like beta-propeller repeat protein [Gaiellales bacterium]|nr:PQQ-binding-like beta-propeller repeat protein [Gaiellales bacterium]
MSGRLERRNARPGSLVSNILSVGTTQYVEYNTQDQTGQFSEHLDRQPGVDVPGRRARPGRRLRERHALRRLGRPRRVRVNATTGVEKWSHIDNLGSPFVAVANSVVYTYSLQVVDALKPKSGHVIWTHTLPAGYSAPPIIGSGSAFHRRLRDVGAQHHQRRPAVVELRGYPGNCQAVGANGVIYCAARNGDVRAYDATGGQSLWSTSLAGGVTAGPIVVNGCLYLGTAQTGRDDCSPTAHSQGRAREHGAIDVCSAATIGTLRNGVFGDHGSGQRLPPSGAVLRRRGRLC